MQPIYVRTAFISFVLLNNTQDLSAAEHLNPKEAYADAALRGLKEELGVDPQAVKQSLEQANIYGLHYIDYTIMRERGLFW
jgi:hypothetical protein